MGLFHWMTRVMARRIVFVRHACTDAPHGALVGSTDLPLSPLGLEQARALAPLVAGLGAGAVYCSPLKRARQTCEILVGDADGITAGAVVPQQHTAGAAVPQVHIDEDLREIDFGAWELKSFEQIAAADGAAVDRWAAFDRGFAFPGGESLGGFLARVRRCAKRLCADEADTVLAVTHGGVIRAMICHLLGLRPRQYVLFDVGNASCAIVEVFDGKGVLSALNLRTGGGADAGLFPSLTLRARCDSLALRARCDSPSAEGG
jgi:broad specificity phosphatase PhoE